MDRDAGGGMSVTVGRLFPDSVFDYRFVVLGHNTIRGAAGAAILNAELLQRSRPAARKIRARNRFTRRSEGAMSRPIQVMKFGGTSVGDADRIRERGNNCRGSGQGTLRRRGGFRDVRRDQHSDRRRPKSRDGR